MTPPPNRTRLERAVRWLESQPSYDELGSRGCQLDIPEFSDLFAAANEPFWIDTRYNSHLPTDRDPETIAKADLVTVRALVTEFTRGERFCEGYWIAEITSGRALRIFARALALLDERAT